MKKLSEESEGILSGNDREALKKVGEGSSGPLYAFGNQRGPHFGGADLGASVKASIQVRSASSLVVTPLDELRPGRPASLKATLLDDKGFGIPQATLRSSQGVEAVTDDFGEALLELAVYGVASSSRLMAGMSITDERDEVIDFTQPYTPPSPSVYIALAGAGEDVVDMIQEP